MRGEGWQEEGKEEVQSEMGEEEEEEGEENGETKWRKRLGDEGREGGREEREDMRYRGEQEGRNREEGEEYNGKLACLPASLQTWASMYAVCDVISLGLHTTVHPAAMAGAILNVSKYRGRFHGEMRPATPTGDRQV